VVVLVAPQVAGPKPGSTFATIGVEGQLAPAGGARSFEELLAYGLGDARIGVRPMPGDGQTIAGRIPGSANAWMLATHSGITLGPLLGRLIAGEIVGGTPSAVLAPFSPERFATPGAPATTRSLPRCPFILATTRRMHFTWAKYWNAALFVPSRSRWTSWLAPLMTMGLSSRQEVLANVAPSLPSPGILYTSARTPFVSAGLDT
jgi:hypothetical protein